MTNPRAAQCGGGDHTVIVDKIIISLLGYQGKYADRSDRDRIGFLGEQVLSDIKVTVSSLSVRVN